MQDELGLMHDNNRDSTMGVLNEEGIEATVIDKSMHSMTYEKNKEGREQSTQKRVDDEIDKHFAEEVS